MDPREPLILVGVDAPQNAADRLARLGANRDFVTELRDAVHRTSATLGMTPSSTVWAGQSLGGLTALTAARWFPGDVDELVVYSPSLWWRPGLRRRPTDWHGEPVWIAEQLAEASPRPIRLAVGDNERLLVGPVTRLAEQLSAAGWPVTLTRYPGGHDLPWWAHLLYTDLTA